MKRAFYIKCWLFPNLPQNVDKIPNLRGPVPKSAVTALQDTSMTYLYMYNIQMLTFLLMTPTYIKRRHHYRY